MKIADMDLSCFDWQEINQPNYNELSRLPGAAESSTPADAGKESGAGQIK